MLKILLVIHLLITVAMVAAVLLQRSEGGGLGLGGGMGLMTARGSANFMTRTTAVLATCFIMASLILAILSAAQYRNKGSILDKEAASAAPLERLALTRPELAPPVDFKVSLLPKEC